MGTPATRRLLGAAVGALLAWAALEARDLRWGGAGPDPCAARASDPAAVERSFAEVLAAAEAGRREEALLALRERQSAGPDAGFASYLLGELAYGEKAYAAAVRHYRAAVEADPSVGDRGAAFDAGRTISRRLADLLQGPWVQRRPPEVEDLYYLQRRLAGGCQ